MVILIVVLGLLSVAIIGTVVGLIALVTIIRRFIARSITNNNKPKKLKE